MKRLFGRRPACFAFLVLGFVLLFAGSAFALSIGSDTVFDVARLVVIPEDGSGGIAAADAVQFNACFTATAFFGQVAFFIRSIIEIFR